MLKVYQAVLSLIIYNKSVLLPKVIAQEGNIITYQLDQNKPLLIQFDGNNILILLFF